MVECISGLYKATHGLGPFANQIELGKQMRTRANLFVANEQWDTSRILDIKIEGSTDLGRNDEQCYPVKMDTSMSVRGDTLTFDQDEFNCKCHLVGCDAMLGPTPKLNMLTNHHLKVLSGLNDKMKWDKQDLLDPRTALSPLLHGMFSTERRRPLRMRMSWDRMDVQEELDSYEETMHNNHGSGKRRVLTEFSEIGRTDSPMTELVGIGRNKVLLQSSVGSIVPRLYNRPHRNWFEEASITDPTRGGQWARKGSPPDEVGALHNDEIGV
ncbi:uncharacterized protein UBRO_20433 [Ustilago bromivora]|uniref:Uncharacterized protein n=1 Tax=Ustilago bromivora TaxID=307758 RepID=A0A1K0FW37_9BASI|nr:uncharacterized protein UBRO_20433 [Ustilago bromivora]